MAGLFVLVGAVLLLVVLSLIMERRMRKDSSLPRKVLHIGVISICAVSLYVVPEWQTLFWTALGSLPIVAIAVAKGMLRDRRTGRRSWGMVYFAAVYVLLLWFFGESRPELVYYPMALLALADGLATLAGEWFGKHAYNLGGDKRSVEGSAAFAVTAFAVLSASHWWVPEPPFYEEYGWPVLLWMVAFITVSEAIAAHGRDNLGVPLLAAYWMLVASGMAHSELLYAAVPVLLTGLSVVAYRQKWLSAGGAATAALLGGVLLLAPLPGMALAALAFFALGTGASLFPHKVEPSGNSELQREKPTRTKAQVLANGGAPVIALMLYFSTGMDALLIAYFAGFAAALSDTLSSEVGVRASGQSYAIVGFARLPAGASGGISWAGTAAGAIGALAIPAIALAAGVVGIQGFWLLGAIAFSANVLDSLLGQWLQAKRLAPDGSWTDAGPGEQANGVSGVRWIDNDMVNACCTLFAVLVAWAVFAI